MKYLFFKNGGLDFLVLHDHVLPQCLHCKNLLRLVNLIRRILLLDQINLPKAALPNHGQLLKVGEGHSLVRAFEKGLDGVSVGRNYIINHIILFISYQYLPKRHLSLLLLIFNQIPQLRVPRQRHIHAVFGDVNIYAKESRQSRANLLSKFPLLLSLACLL